MIEATSDVPGGKKLFAFSTQILYSGFPLSRRSRRLFEWLMHVTIEDNVFLDDWVGPVSATIKLWEKRYNREPCLRDGPISINPPEHNSRNPTIRIGDIVTPGQRKAEFDAPRELELDLWLYRRAWRFLRPWSDHESIQWFLL